MDPRIKKTASSFRKEFIARPSGYRTPSPPRALVELIWSDEGLDYHELSHTHALENAAETFETQALNFRAFGRKQDSSSRVVGCPAYETVLSDLLPNAARYANQVALSPLDVFATVATSPSINGSFLGPYKSARQADQPQHRGVRGENIKPHTSYHPEIRNEWEERPCKRRRSEVTEFRPYLHSSSRPASSHVAQSDCVRSPGTVPHGNFHAKTARLEQESTVRSPRISPNKLSDAQLLLAFSRGHNLQSSQLNKQDSSKLVTHLNNDCSNHDANSLTYKNTNPKLGGDQKVQQLPRDDQPYNDGQPCQDDQARLYSAEEIQLRQRLGTNQSVDNTEKLMGMPLPTLNRDAVVDECEAQCLTVPAPVSEEVVVNTLGQTTAGSPGGASKCKLRGFRGSGRSTKQPRKVRGSKGAETQSTSFIAQEPPWIKSTTRRNSSRKHKPANEALVDPLLTIRCESEPVTTSEECHGLNTVQGRDFANEHHQRRSSSVPCELLMSVGPDRKFHESIRDHHQRQDFGDAHAQSNTCTACHSAQDPHNGSHDLWIRCHSCKDWYHVHCAGFKTEREAKNVDRFYCKTCEVVHGQTTFVRKSTRAHTSLDYASLNEGKIRMSTDVPEHHYIEPIKEGTIQFQRDNFARMRPELVTAEYFERCHGFTEPIVIPAWMNPRPSIPGTTQERLELGDAKVLNEDDHSRDLEWFSTEYEYDCVHDDGQDKLDMVIPQGLTVRTVAELYGTEEKIDVIDVKKQEAEDRRWNLRQWADYYEAEGEKPVRNVISLEVSQSKLGRLIRRPKVVRALDLQDSVWPPEEAAKGSYPKVQFYCLMSVADCYTDFHIDFGGSSVYYHILKGRKTFFFIPPRKQHLKKYEEWCLSRDQNSIFLGNETKECYRVDLFQGDTMLIPSGWIHAVWTPENSLVIGGNFLTRMHYGMQIQINDIEKNTGVARKFRYPYFQRVMWLTVVRYLERDPVPSTVAQALCNGGQFVREKPVFRKYHTFEEREDECPERFDARYYSQSEIEGLHDLLGYIFRTVMVSLGKIAGITKAVQDAVTRSMPKGYGEPLELAKTFAMWVAWKRGNETLAQWAHPHAPLPEELGEKKLSAATMRKIERQAAHDARILSSGRRLSRQTPKALNAALATTPSSEQASANKESDSLPRPRNESTSNPHNETLVPDKLHSDTNRPESLTRFGIKLVQQTSPAVATTHLTTPISRSDTASEQLTAQCTNDLSKPAMLVAVMINTGNRAKSYLTSTSENKSKEDQGLPVETFITETTNILEGDTTVSSTRRSRMRTSACDICRKAKRRCVHDENGNVDPVKCSSPPVLRGPRSIKRDRTPEEDNIPSIKRPRIEVEEFDSLGAGGPQSPRSKCGVDGQESAGSNLDPFTSLSYDYKPPASSYGHESSADLFMDESFRRMAGGPKEQVADLSTERKQALNYDSDDVQANSAGKGASPIISADGLCFPGIATGRGHENMTEALKSPQKQQLQLSGAENTSRANVAVAKSYSGSNSDSRSRTPSLHDKTYSTESGNASMSPPPSPLTEDDSSLPMSSEGNPFTAIGSAGTRRDSSRQRKPVDLFAKSVYSANPPGVERPDRRSFDQVPTASTVPQSVLPESNAMVSKPGNNRQRDTGGKPQRADMLMQPSSKGGTGTTLEERTKKLIEQLLGEDRGLRPRRRC